MRKLFCLFGLVFCTGCCFAQQGNSTQSSAKYTCTLLVNSAKEVAGPSSKTLFIANLAGDSLAVYTVYDGIVGVKLIYALEAVNGVATLTARSADSTEPADSLTIRFADALKAVHTNKDSYLLYDAAYSRFKQAVLYKHSIMAVFALLQDRLGDYPIEEALPLLLFIPNLGTEKSIREAQVVTARSQSDEVWDTWEVTYQYTKAGRLIKVRASAEGVVYFSRSINYGGAGVSSVKYYRNIESRQVTNGSITYKPGNSKVLTVQEAVLETGKNRETHLQFTLRKLGLAPVKRMVMPASEILRLIP